MIRRFIKRLFAPTRPATEVDDTSPALAEPPRPLEHGDVVVLMGQPVKAIVLGIYEGRAWCVTDSPVRVVFDVDPDELVRVAPFMRSAPALALN